MATATFLERIIEPISRGLTPEAAAEIVSFHADEGTQLRIDDLANKCTEGTLTAEERAEYHDYVSMFNVLTLLQVKARRILNDNSGG